MRVPIPFALTDSVPTVLRSCGYHYHSDFNTGADSYIRRLGRDFYPRFHIYVETKDNAAVLNLHLDQKKPSYAGAHAHNADYDGDVVEREASRILSIISNRQQHQPEAMPPQPTLFQRWFGN